MTIAGYEYPSPMIKMRYQGSTHGVDRDTGWVRPLVAMTTAGYEYPSTMIKMRCQGSTHGVDLDTGWVRLLVAMTIAGYEYPSAEMKAEVSMINSWSQPRYRMGTAARRDDDCRL